MSQSRGGVATGTPAQERELRARGRHTMRRLLDAGAEVFARRGYHAARVDDVVKRARASHGTFYLYFANKEDLFRALASEVEAEMAELAKALPRIDPDPEGHHALRAWLARVADAYERHGAVIRTWTEADIGGDGHARLGTHALAGFTRILTERIAGGAARADSDPRIVALALVAMIERFNYYVLTGQVDVGRDEMLDTLAAVTRAGLFGGGGPSG